MTIRIEFQERFLDVTPEEMDSCERAGMPPPKTYSYRRIYVRLSDIFAPKEIPGKKAHCQVEFYDGSTITVKGSYDTICTLIDDRQKLVEEDDLEL